MIRSNGRGVLVPRAPLVYHELDLVLAIDLAHDVPRLPDQGVHAVRLIKQLIRIVRTEVNGIALSGGHAVIMQRPAPDPVEQTRRLGCDRVEEVMRPLGVAGIGARSDERHWVAKEGHPGDKLPELHRVLLGCHVAATPPTLIADTPEADIEWLGRAI